MTRTRGAARTALCALLLVPSLAAAQEVLLRQYTTTDGLGHNIVSDVFQDSRGFVWLATADGLSRFDGTRFVTLRSADGVPRLALTAVGETGDTLWAATRAGEILHLVEGPGGPQMAIQRERVSGPTAVRPSRRVIRVPQSLDGIGQRLFEPRGNDGEPLVIRGARTAVMDVLEDRSGSTWLATSGSGVFVVPSEPIVSYTAADELPDEYVLRLVESRDGRIYAVTRRGGVAHLKDDSVEAVPGSLFAPFHTIGRRILQDEDGSWWFWTNGGLFTAPGPALSFTRARAAHEQRPLPPDALPFVDRRGWRWTALRGGGVSLCKPRGSGVPDCVDYTTGDGVAHQVTSAAEDAYGRLYVGTRRGALRFDAGDGRFETIASDRKLARATVTDCMRDSRGRIWIATSTGVFSLTPRPPRATEPTEVYVTAVHASGGQIAAPPRGALALTSLAVDARRNTLQLEYAAPGAETNDAFYQHRLAGLDDEWSAPTRDRSVTYSALRPRSYRFEVRSITSSGKTGIPSSVEIAMARHAWAPWWLPAAGAAILLLGGWWLRQAQRAHGRRDLPGVTLRMLGGMEEQPEHRGGHGSATDGPRLAQR